MHADYFMQHASHRLVRESTRCIAGEINLLYFDSDFGTCLAYVPIRWVAVMYHVYDSNGKLSIASQQVQDQVGWADHAMGARATPLPHVRACKGMKLPLALAASILYLTRPFYEVAANLSSGY